MIKGMRYSQSLKILFFFVLSFLLCSNIYISYGESTEYMILASAFVAWSFYELYGMAFTGRWMVGLGIMVDEEKGVGMQYVNIKFLLFPIYFVLAVAAAFGGLWL